MCTIYLVSMYYYTYTTNIASTHYCVIMMPVMLVTETHRPKARSRVVRKTSISNGDAINENEMLNIIDSISQNAD